jgi:hypothetical protein
LGGSNFSELYNNHTMISATRLISRFSEKNAPDGLGFSLTKRSSDSIIEPHDYNADSAERVAIMHGQSADQASP